MNIKPFPWFGLLITLAAVLLLSTTVEASAGDRLALMLTAVLTIS